MTDDAGRLGAEVDLDVVVIEEPRQDFASRLGEAARDNPASAALIAMGAVWLFAGGSRVSIFGGRIGSRTSAPPPGMGAQADARYASGHSMGPDAEARLEGAARHTGDRTRDGLRATRDAAGRIGEDAGRAASTAGDATADAARAVASGVGIAADRAGDALSSARMATSRTARSAWHEAEDLGRSVREVLEDRPLAIAALGLAAGAGLALALPRTEAERELMGERSEAVRGRVRDAAGERIGAARQGAEAALSRAVRDARAQGLTEDAVSAAIEEFTAKIEKVALAARDAAEGEIKGAQT